MNTKVLIKEAEKSYITCVIENDEWKEILAEPRERSILHNIYVGKVTSVSKNVEAAFVSIGTENCYLPFKECQGAVPKSGDEIVVQVIKERMKTKDAMVSRDLSISGRYFVLTSANSKTGVSAKITDSKERTRLGGIVRNIKPKDSAYGVVVRTNAAGVSEENLKKELETLCLRLDSLYNMGTMRTCYSVLYRSPAAYLEKIRNIELASLNRIITDSMDVYQELCHIYPTEFYQDSMLSMDKLYRFDTHIAEAVQKKVWLKSGGYLVIEPTEALTVIDVNTGKFSGKKKSEETFSLINREAAREIARQLRLRNLSGIIVVDFINMKKKEDEDELTAMMTTLVKSDKAQTKVLGLTRLGLMEITRMKVRKPLREQLEEAGYEVRKYT